MATPRSKLVDSENALSYHLVSRCVRGAFLCGRDPTTGRDCSHRRRWLIDRLLFLAQFFAVEIDSYAVLSNHFHLAAHYDPKACLGWSEAEVARRWVAAFPPMEDGVPAEDRKPLEQERLLADPKRLARARATLGSLSSFMKHLKQPIARRANKEDGVKGHFFEQRFYSGALLDDEAVLAAMAYIDLNPVRAKLANHLSECRDASIGERLRVNRAQALDEFLAPLASGLDCVQDLGGGSSDAPVSGIGESEETTSDTGRLGPAPRIRMTLRGYIELLEGIMAARSASAKSQGPDSAMRWLARVTSMRKRQRAYGRQGALSQWMAQRGMRCWEVPLSA
ncbi:MAG: transposase [Gammaproteobacteria bacterium]|nr:transposase [Gammaproteobacteria bacterium]